VRCCHIDAHVLVDCSLALLPVVHCPVATGASRRRRGPAGWQRHSSSSCVPFGRVGGVYRSTSSPGLDQLGIVCWCVGSRPF
jgi:hypothetical protein